MKAIKKIIITLILFVIFGGASFIDTKELLNETNQQQINFSGKWNWEKNDSYSTFRLELKQLANNISGYHCAISQNGNRIDCWGIDNNEYSIIGKIKDGLATVTIKSYFSNNIEKDTGIATIKFITPNKIEWKIIKDTQGQNYFPKEAILVRESSLPELSSKEEEKESEPSPKWELIKSSDYDKGYLDESSAYEQCKNEQIKEREFLDRDRQTPIEKMGWEAVEYQAEFQECKKRFFYGIKRENESYQEGFEEGWRDASMPLNKDRETKKKD